MLRKSLIDECVKQCYIWGMFASLGSFLTATFLPYFTGFESSMVTSLCGGLLSERAFACFAFVYNWTHKRPIKIGE